MIIFDSHITICPLRRVSKEDWKELDPGITAIVNEIEDLIHCSLLDPFLAALSTLTLPAVLLRDLIDEMAVMAETDSQGAFVGRITEQLFCKNSLSDIRNSFATKHKQSWSALVGKLKKADLAKTVEQLKCFQDKVKNEKVKNEKGGGGMKKKGGPALAEYSRWFSKYCPNSLELPGQYTGCSKPVSSLRKTISRFEDNILVLSSLRRPVRLTLLLDNGERYPVLVKGGEDLRTDQRVMQLLRVMDRTLQTTLRDASLKTYDVIPLSNSLGMIAWMPGTTTLQSVLYEDKEFKKAASRAKQDFNAWVSKFGTAKDGDHDCYRKMYERCSLDDVTLQRKKLTSNLPADRLKSVLVGLARSPNSFVTLRRKFVCTYVSMCLCHWILGVGDRHLNNYLLDTRTGELIGIDFGHVFGTATTVSLLPVFLLDTAV